jgi:hypothetical protein
VIVRAYTHRIVFGALAIVLFSSCTKQKDILDMQMAKAPLCTDLKILSGKRIIFGHQSVGADIMNGVDELQLTSGCSHLALHRGMETRPSGGWFIDTLVGKNSDPQSKCDAFRTMVEALADSVDIALMKFCYVDIKDTTDVDDMFSHYVATIDSLKRTCPRVTLVHVTVPVTERSSLWRRWAKRLLGKKDVWEIAAARRAAFNRKLLTHFRDDPVFDLAKVESTLPDGSRCRYEYGKEEVFSLAAEYSRDGGHLNAEGRRVIARQLLSTLAEVAKGSTP